MLSLALNVSLLLRMVYETEEDHSSKKTMIAEVETKRENRHIVQKSRLAISSSTRSLANSTRADHPGDKERVINLDQ